MAGQQLRLRLLLLLLMLMLLFENGNGRLRRRSSGEVEQGRRRSDSGRHRRRHKDNKYVIELEGNDSYNLSFNRTVRNGHARTFSSELIHYLMKYS
jgi:hypothetical protein